MNFSWRDQQIPVHVRLCTNERPKTNPSRVAVVWVRHYYRNTSKLKQLFLCLWKHLTGCVFLVKVLWASLFFHQPLMGPVCTSLVWIVTGDEYSREHWTCHAQRTVLFDTVQLWKAIATWNDRIRMQKQDTKITGPQKKSLNTLIHCYTNHQCNKNNKQKKKRKDRSQIRSVYLQLLKITEDK